MIERIGNWLQLAGNMGPRYVLFRVAHELRRRTGQMKRKFPNNPPQNQFIGLDEWRRLPVKAFFDGKSALPKDAARRFEPSRARLKPEAVDWLLNEDTGFRYDASMHWTAIPDISKEAGDIKTVWEKSRFSFVYGLIRDDFFNEADHAEEVFLGIESWITANPINGGPNWRCSQEISLRVFAWIFALQYYKASPALTESRFERIMRDIYWQIRHVEENIQFSRIAVRNNHTLTETLALYLTGLLLPFFPESEKWKKLGKEWFEEEIAYQIYPDGTYLQHSMNYHRVAVQLLTWAIVLAHANNERWAEVVYNRAEKSVAFLLSCQDKITGRLPNYGNNDGALFFPLAETNFRDYRPQLLALGATLGMQMPYEKGAWDEELFWITGGKGSPAGPAARHTIKFETGAKAFANGGYYVLRSDDSLTFLRCAQYKDRPFQADNLHLDIWVNGENILHDAGTYKYNAEKKWLERFVGTPAHNSVSLGDEDQMRRGERFIWYDWIKSAKARWTEIADEWVFEGEFEGFARLGNAKHHRSVRKLKHHLTWIIEDTIYGNARNREMKQHWHPSAYFLNNFRMDAYDENGRSLAPKQTDGWYSDRYGEKEGSPAIEFITHGRYIRTEISAIRHAEA